MSLYDAIGGHPTIERMVDAFYDRMCQDPRAAAIRAMHDDDLTAARHKLTAFLSGWLGGPPLYWEGADDVRLRERHRHLPIDAAARAAWLRCMSGALGDAVADASLRAALLQRFQAAAAAVQNDQPTRPLTA